MNSEYQTPIQTLTNAVNKTKVYRAVQNKCQKCMLKAEILKLSCS